ncbi:hypothetical protein, partial [Solidesulfovibrio sp.]|uniref:hypothetical protein n=1 Tax=Solidesulfovibrio sp. TaxID=2910990 RepID=UPI002B205355
DNMDQSAPLHGLPSHRNPDGGTRLHNRADCDRLSGKIGKNALFQRAAKQLMHTQLVLSSNKLKRYLW